MRLKLSNVQKNEFVLPLNFSKLLPRKEKVFETKKYLV